MLKPQEWDNTSTDNKYGIQYVRANHNKQQLQLQIALEGIRDGQKKIIGLGCNLYCKFIKTVKKDGITSCSNGKNTKIKLLKCSYGHTNEEHSICHRWSQVIQIETIKSDKRKKINVRKNVINSKIIKCKVRNCGYTSNKKVYITTH